MRVAVYYAPEPEDPLWSFGCAWLGRDPEAERPVSQPIIPGLAEATRSPRRYGFHATLKPPFALAGPLGAFERDLAALAARLDPLALPPFEVRRLGGFAALCLAEASAGLSELAAACVTVLDLHRAPEDPQAKARRAEGLSPAEAAHLDRWGYPYVLDAWRFHMTLCGNGAATPSLLAAAAAHFGETPAIPRRIESLALFIESEPGAAFRLARRVRLGSSSFAKPAVL